MSENDLEALVAPKHAGIKHVDHGTGRVERRLDQSAIAPQARRLEASGGRMNEKRRLAAVELVPHRLVAGIAEIDSATIAQDGEALRAELVDAAADFRDGAGRIGHRQLREKPEALRMDFDQRGTVGVRGDNPLDIAELAAVGNDLRRDARAVHIGNVGLGREGPGFVRLGSGGAAQPVSGRNEMAVNVDPSPCHDYLRGNSPNYNAMAARGKSANQLDVNHRSNGIGRFTGNLHPSGIAPG